jgi:hypothetical protein
MAPGRDGSFPGGAGYIIWQGNSEHPAWPGQLVASHEPPQLAYPASLLHAGLQVYGHVSQVG